jgi:predicted permease
MSSLTGTVLFVFGLVALGYGAGRTGYLKADAGAALSQFAVGVALPVLLFRTMVGADFHGAAPWALWATYFTAVAVTWSCGHLVTTRIFGRDSQTGVVGGVASAFSNLVLLGIPFMLGIFGEQGFEVLSLIVAVHLPIMLASSIVMFEIFGKGSNTSPLQIAATFLGRLFRNPLIIGILAGLIWRLTGVPLPGLFGRLVDALADVAGPVALFAIGLELVNFGLSGNIRPAFALSAVKLLLMPLVALGAALLFGLPPLSAKVAVIAAALPSGINSYLIAVQFGTGQGLASNQLTIATAGAVLTTAFWLMVLQMVFG